MPSAFIDEVVRRLSEQFGEPDVTDKFKWRVPSRSGLRPSISVIVKGTADESGVVTWVFAPKMSEDIRHRQVSSPDEIEELIEWIRTAADR